MLTMLDLSGEYMGIKSMFFNFSVKNFTVKSQRNKGPLLAPNSLEYLSSHFLFCLKSLTTSIKRTVTELRYVFLTNIITLGKRF